MTNRVVHFEIQANNIQRAKDFYEKTFGWRIVQQMSKEKDGMDYWGVITGETDRGINGGMYKRNENDPLHTYDCTIQVDDIDEAVERVKANGGDIRIPKGEIAGVGFFAGATDTEENRFGMIQMNEMT